MLLPGEVRAFGGAAPGGGARWGGGLHLLLWCHSLIGITFGNKRGRRHGAFHRRTRIAWGEGIRLVLSSEMRTLTFLITAHILLGRALQSFIPSLLGRLFRAQRCTIRNSFSRFLVVARRRKSDISGLGMGNRRNHKRFTTRGAPNKRARSLKIEGFVRPIPTCGAECPEYNALSTP